MAFFDNINGLNGLVAGAAGGSSTRLVLPPPTVSRLTEEFSVILVPEAEPISFSVIFGLDPNIQVEQGIKIFLDPRVYSSLALGHEDDKREVKPEHDGFCKIGGVIW